MLSTLQCHETSSPARQNCKIIMKIMKERAVITVLKFTSDDFPLMDSGLSILECKWNTGVNFTCKANVWMFESTYLSSGALRFCLTTILIRVLCHSFVQKALSELLRWGPGMLACCGCHGEQDKSLSSCGLRLVEERGSTTGNKYLM